MDEFGNMNVELPFAPGPALGGWVPGYPRGMQKCRWLTTWRFVPLPLLCIRNLHSLRQNALSPRMCFESLVHALPQSRLAQDSFPQFTVAAPQQLECMRLTRMHQK